MASRWSVLIALVLALGVVMPVGAITFGERDVDDEYPYVVVVYIFAETDHVFVVPDPDGRDDPVVISGIVPAWGCSGSLISDDVVLTVSHCTGDFFGGFNPHTAWVLFGNDLSGFNEVFADIVRGFRDDEFDVATPPSVDDLSIEEIVIGKPVVHHDFANFAEFPQTYDIGVVELDDPGPEGDYGPYPSIAPLGYLDDLMASTPSSQIEFTAVGYGDQRVQVIGALPPGGGPGGANASWQRHTIITEHESDFWRHVGSLRPINLKSADAGGYNVQLSSNPGRWSGGTCFGDSGGPILHGDKIVALTSFGRGNVMCRGNNSFAYRTDIEASQEFLAPYLNGED